MSLVASVCLYVCLFVCEVNGAHQPWVGMGVGGAFLVMNIVTEKQNILIFYFNFNLILFLLWITRKGDSVFGRVCLSVCVFICEEVGWSVGMATGVAFLGWKIATDMRIFLSLFLFYY